MNDRKNNEGFFPSFFSKCYERKILSGVATLVILLAITTPAIGEVTYLTNSNHFSAGEFNVSVDLNGTAGNISINLIDWPDNIIPMGFEAFLYNLSTRVTTVSEDNSSWGKHVGMPNADGFGDFQSNKVKHDCGSYCHPIVKSYGYGIVSPLVFTLNQPFIAADLKPNDQGSSLAAHLVFKLNEGNCTICTWISDGVSKSHTTLGHVVNAGADQMMDKGDLLTINLTFKDGMIKGSNSGGGDSGEEEGDFMEGEGGDEGGKGGDEGSKGGGDTGGSGSKGGDEGSKGGGGETGGSGGHKGIPHGYCELHPHTIAIDWGAGYDIEIREDPVTPLDEDCTHCHANWRTRMVNATYVNLDAIGDGANGREGNCLKCHGDPDPKQSWYTGN